MSNKQGDRLISKHFLHGFSLAVPLGIHQPLTASC